MYLINCLGFGVVWFGVGFVFFFGGGGCGGFGVLVCLVFQNKLSFSVLSVFQVCQFEIL